MPGHGPAEDGSGRRTILIKIDSSWGSTTNTTIWNQTGASRTDWNNARDQFGNSTGYYLKVDQGTSTPDIIIKKGSVPAGSCATSSPTGPPYTITLPADIVNLNDAIVRGRISHEIGHTLGLSNDESCGSIMNTSNADCTRTSNDVLVGDVAAVNRNFSPNRSTQCHADGTTSDTGGGDNGDPCNGDPCCGDPCCGDPCCGDPCCGDPCCGDPNCGQECYTVCVTSCYSACTAYDDYGECYWTEEICETSCETQCY